MENNEIYMELLKNSLEVDKQLTKRIIEIIDKNKFNEKDNNDLTIMTNLDNLRRQNILTVNQMQLYLFDKKSNEVKVDN